MPRRPGEPALLVDVSADGVATLTLNRPDVHNAINRQMVEEFHAALERLEPEDSLRALVVAGAGGRAFASGADIAELRDRREADALEGINGDLFSRLERFPRPTVAAIVGFCLGGGCEMAMACDFRVAGRSSRFGQPEVGLGIMAAAGGTRRLPRLVGPQRARRLLYSGAIVSADEALQIGLIDVLVDDPEVPGAARALLEPILQNAPQAVRLTKEALLAWLHGEGEADLRRRDDRSQAVLFEDPEKFARMDAFLARRPPKGAGGNSPA